MAGTNSRQGVRASVGVLHGLGRQADHDEKSSVTAHAAIGKILNPPLHERAENCDDVNQDTNDDTNLNSAPEPVLS